MSNLHIVTGYKGEPHVKAEDHGALNAAVFGSGEYVLKNGNQFAATVISNNQVRVLDGCIMMQGRHVRMEEGNYVDLSIENGTQGTYRNDLIVARYTKDATSGVEDCNLVVIKGTETSSNPSDPAYTKGNILADHDLRNDMLLYRVPLVGLNVQELVPLFSLSVVNFQDIGNKQDETNYLAEGTTLSDGDYFPFYDASAASNRKTPWSNIVAKIRTALFGTANGILRANGSGVVSGTTIGTNDISASAVTYAKLGSDVTPAKLGCAVPSVAKTATLTSSGWASNKQTVSVSGVTASNHLVIAPAAASYVAYAESVVRCTAQASGSLTFQCEEAPTANLTVNILIVG